jgi:8-oxo-dGTP pyrophosphatase MutT (NUDIX family)
MRRVARRQHTPLRLSGTNKKIATIIFQPLRCANSMTDFPSAAADPDATGLVAELTAYARRWPDEAEAAAQFAALHGDGADPFVRERTAGHFTASCWLVDRSGTRVLLTHHRKLQRWLQLGGHADGDRDLAQVALREAQEESGLDGLRVERELFDIDRHWIPERGDVAGHWHYDARYVVHAGANEDYVVSEESLDLEWRGIDAIAEDPHADASLRRMAGKWRMRCRQGGR